MLAEAGQALPSPKDASVKLETDRTWHRRLLHEKRKNVPAVGEKSTSYVEVAQQLVLDRLTII